MFIPRFLGTAAISNMNWSDKFRRGNKQIIIIIDYRRVIREEYYYSVIFKHGDRANIGIYVTTYTVQ